jgi:hypothetical protein
MSKNAAGNREDLQDAIYNVSPEETPFLTAAKRMKATNTYHEWQVDALAAATAGNAKLEGDDATTNTTTATTRFGNFCQIATKVPRVSGTQRRIDTAGRSDELTYQVEEKRWPELKLDVEKTCLGLQKGVVRTSTVAGVSGGMARWLFNNQMKVGTADAHTTTAITTAPTVTMTAGTATALTEADLQTLMGTIWAQGGQPTMILCGATNKARISKFAGIAGITNQASKANTIIGAADRYLSDFGELSVVPCRQMPAGNVYVIDPEYWAVAYLRPYERSDLARTGDADRKLLLVEFTLAALNPKSSGKIYTTT